MFVYSYRCGKLLYYLYRLFYNETDNNILAVKKAAGQCGVIGMKFLQFMMMHDGFLSAEGKKHFGYVFEDCDYHRWEDTCKLYQADFGKHIHEDFKLNEDSAIVIGSGSIGQVYKLWDRAAEKEVAVKVRHPGVEVQAVRFINNVGMLLTLLEYICTVPFSFLLREFLNNIHCQLDYSQEAKNTTRLHELFKEEDCIIVPTVVRCSKNFIVMDYYEGKSYTKVEDHFKQFVAVNIYLFMLTSITCFDFLHCDLHYGNWKVTEDHKIIVYDCGIIGTTKQLEKNKQLTQMFIDGDYTKMSDILFTEKDTRSKEKIKRCVEKEYKNSSERLTDIIKGIIMDNVKVDTRLFRCFQGFITCKNVAQVDTDRLVKILGETGNNKYVLISYYLNILKRLKRFNVLTEKLQAWVDEDPTYETVFSDWLEESFGHRDKEVFIDVMMERMFPHLR